MPKAIIVCGTPGSGKTTHARQLATTGGATLLDIDTVTEGLCGVRTQIPLILETTVF